MKIFVRNRNEGKTKNAIQVARETGAYLAVASEMEARRIIAYNPELKGKVITFHRLLENGLLGIPGARIVIDNADDLLHLVCRNVGIEAVTMNGFPL
jgi:hypothetical protein